MEKRPDSRIKQNKPKRGGCLRREKRGTSRIK